MHARTEELLDHLERSHAALRTAVEAVPESLRESPPAPDRWSAAQVVEHLAITAAGVAALLSRALRKLEREGLRPATDASPVLPTMDSGRLLDRERRIEAPEAVRPKGSLTLPQAWITFEESHREVADTLRAGDGIDVATITAPHAALGELGFHGWIAFVGLHEQRHAAQLRELAQVACG